MGRSSNVSFARAVPVALLLGLAAPVAARADATITVSGSAPSKTLRFKVNDVGDHSTTATIVSGDLVITEATGIASGCAQVSAGSANCGPAGDFGRVEFEFSAGNDTLRLPDDFPIAVGAEGWAGNDVLEGGSGNDFLRGWTGDDVLDGRAGDDQLLAGSDDDYLSGGTGSDMLDGDYGDDLLEAAETPPHADATITCGPGIDALAADDVDDLPVDCETTDAPYLDGDLRITGDAQAARLLSLSLPTNIGGDGDVTIQWERCDASGNNCADIAGAQYPTYWPTSADVGLRIRAWYGVENALGDDWIEADATDIVQSASVAPPTPRPPTTRPPRPPRPRPTLQPPRPHVDPLKLTIAPFVVAGKPSFAVRNGRPVVDTGRKMACPGVAGGLPCKVHIVAYPSGASGHVHGRPNVAAESTVTVAAAADAKVRFTLGRRAYAQLRAHHKLTLLINATITRPHSAPVRTTFTATVKTPARKRR
jgi:Ca2+-binding RTX toxin-like protein